MRPKRTTKHTENIRATASKKWEECQKQLRFNIYSKNPFERKATKPLAKTQNKNYENKKHLTFLLSISAIYCIG